ncbi:MAG: IS1634 family transposase, partial [Desulfobulbia bacterium]
KSVYHIEQTTFVGDRGMITKLNLSRIEGEGFDYVMGVKSRQDEVCGMLLTTENGPAADFERYKGLRIKERRVGIKAFLIWKVKEILKQHDITACDEAVNAFAQKIHCLTNQDEPDYASFKPLLQNLLDARDSKLCYRLFRLIKKYTGRYEEQPRYIICLNEERQALTENKRAVWLAKLSKQLEKWKPTQDQSSAEIEQGLHKIFEGAKGRFKKFFEIERDPSSGQATGYHLNETMVEQEKKRDGIFILLTTRDDFQPSKVVDSYKELKEVEALFNDLKNFVDIQPIRHWLVRRVRAHVFVCIMALLLKRIFEINYLRSKSTMQPLEEISKSKLILYKVRFSERDDRTQIIPKVTTPNPLQKKYFNMVGITRPMSLERFVW